jgi:hypothetical protein
MFSFKRLLIYLQEAEWTPLLTHYYSENLVVPGIELKTSGSAARSKLNAKNVSLFEIVPA